MSASNSPSGSDGRSWLHESVEEPISGHLRRFLSSYPYERRTIWRFLRYATAQIDPGSLVLDAGAGDAPYRELFREYRYVTADFAATQYHDFARSGLDTICDLSELPFMSGSIDAIISTQVLEHVPTPAKVLGEFRRVLRAGGHLFLTVPLIWELHEMPYDFYRYTPFSLDRLLREAGFTVTFIEPRGGAYWALADLLHRTELWLPPAHSLWERARNVFIDRMLRRVVVPLVATGERWGDSQRLTLGYACHARASA